MIPPAKPPIEIEGPLLLLEEEELVAVVAKGLEAAVVTAGLATPAVLEACAFTVADVSISSLYLVNRTQPRIKSHSCLFLT